jgi:ribose transport system permease protein
MMTMQEKRKDLIQKFAAVGSLAVLYIVFSLTSGGFRTTTNLLTIALQVCTIAYLGLGMTVVIITGGIDLSVGSVLALAGVVSALLVKNGSPVWVGLAAGLVVGALCGLVNGLFVAKAKLPPFIATLGMMMVARGVALDITGGGRAVAGMGEAFGVLGNGALFKVMTIGEDGYPDIKFVGIPYPVIAMVILAVIVAVILMRTRFGRHVYATGSNNEAARLSGVNTTGITLMAYVLSGFFAGVTGVVLMSRLVTGQPNEGVSYELDAIAAAVIGGASLTSGGIGTISGTIIGAFVIGVLRNGLNMNGVQFSKQMIVIGVVILFAVWIDQLRNKRSTRVRVFAKQQQQTEKSSPPAATSAAKRAVE